MHRLLIALLVATALLAAEDKPAPHSGAFVGRMANVPLTSGGKAAGTADLTFGTETIESKWLANHGFPKVPYEAKSIAKTANGIAIRIDTTVTNEKGNQLMFSATLKGDTYTLDGTMSLINKKSGEVETFAFKGKTTAKGEKK